MASKRVLLQDEALDTEQTCVCVFASQFPLTYNPGQPRRRALFTLRALRGRATTVRKADLGKEGERVSDECISTTAHLL